MTHLQVEKITIDNLSFKLTDSQLKEIASKMLLYLQVKSGIAVSYQKENDISVNKRFKKNISKRHITIFFHKISDFLDFLEEIFVASQGDLLLIGAAFQEDKLLLYEKNIKKTIKWFGYSNINGLIDNLDQFNIVLEVGHDCQWIDLYVKNSKQSVDVAKD